METRYYRKQQGGKGILYIAFWPEGKGMNSNSIRVGAFFVYKMIRITLGKAAGL